MFYFNYFMDYLYLCTCKMSRSSNDIHTFTIFKLICLELKYETRVKNYNWSTS